MNALDNTGAMLEDALPPLLRAKDAAPLHSDLLRVVQGLLDTLTDTLHDLKEGQYDEHGHFTG